MRLKRLEIYGFKSFPQRTEIVLGDGVTGIVGPNGSGKSNIGDAVRWVLGEQSAKALRGAKMEDVIFGGTEKRKALTYCEVSLTLANEDGQLKTPRAEVMVTRRAYRTGESEYQLNKAPCRLRDILELFRDTGIGREGYSLIGQGRIDEILSQKGEERRQVFEEAAGIVTFRVRKEEAERKLQRTRENLARVGDILQELSDRLPPLQAQAQTAQEYIELGNRLKILELNAFLIRHDRGQERLRALTEALEGVKDALLQHEARLSECAKEREELDAKVSGIDDALSLRRAQSEEAAADAREKRARYERLSQQIDSAKEYLKALTEDQNACAKRVESLRTENRIQDDSSFLDALKKAKDESAKAALAETEKQSEEEALEKELSEHQAKILEAMSRLGDLKSQRARREEMRSQMEKRLSEVLESADSLSEKRLPLEDALKNAEGERAQAKETLSHLSDQLKAAEEALRLKTEESARARDEAQKVSLKLQADESRLRLMEEMARNMEGYAQAVRKALSRFSGDGRVRGALAQLVTVPKELETAMDMALGGALQNIVTDDEATAKRVIEYLRSENVGRATFLPLSSVRGRTLSYEEKRLLSMPGALGVASEMVEYAEEYRGVVESLLGRTVVAKDMDAGIPIMRAGRQAFRLVTLQGDVMHSGGSITGGAVASRSVSLLGRERAARELADTVEQETAALYRLRETLEKIESDREQMKRARLAVQESAHQEEISLARGEAHVESAKQELSLHDDRISQTQAALAQLREGILQIEQDIMEDEARGGQDDEDREKLDARTEELQAALYKKREELALSREELAAARLSEAEARHLLDEARRNLSRYEAEKEAAQAALNAAIGKREKQEQDIFEGEARLAGDEMAVSQAEEREKSESEGMRDLERSRQEAAARQRECVRRTEEIHALHEDDAQKLHRLELSFARAEGDLKTLTDHIFNTYELTYEGAEAFRTEEKFDLSAGEREAGELKARIRLLGPVNVMAVEEYAAAKERYEDLSTQQADALKAESDLTALIARLLSQMETQFTQAFSKLSEYFTETFARLFGGGHAELSLGDKSAPLDCGIEIVAQPPGKKLQLLSLLSGGERSLTAIAILFAMLKLKPTPFCILDEIEAALDEANITYFADYLREYSQSTQFIVVTHRKGTMERCDALYGVAMEEKGVSRMVSVDLSDYQ